MATVITMFEPTRRARRRFTLVHGLAASLALHGAACLPLAADLWANDGQEPALSLAFDLEGALSDNETEEATAQDTKGAQQPEQPPTEVTRQEPPPPDAEDDDKGDIPQNTKQASTTPPPQAKKADPGARDTTGEDEERKAQTSAKRVKEEDDPVNAYAKQLSKRIRRLAYPAKARAAGLHGSATVSFTIAANGQIVASSLQILASSGQPQLDADALKTVRAASPFAPPPHQMSVAIDVFSNRN